MPFAWGRGPVGPGVFLLFARYYPLGPSGGGHFIDLGEEERHRQAERHRHERKKDVDLAAALLLLARRK